MKLNKTKTMVLLISPLLFLFACGQTKKPHKAFYSQLKALCKGSVCSNTSLGFTSAAKQECKGNQCQADIYFSFERGKLAQVRCVHGDRFAIVLAQRIERHGKNSFIVRVKNKQELKPQGIRKESLKVVFTKSGFRTGCYGDLLFGPFG